MGSPFSAKRSRNDEFYTNYDSIEYIYKTLILIILKIRRFIVTVMIIGHLIMFVGGKITSRRLE